MPPLLWSLSAICESAYMSGTVTSHANGLPFAQGSSVYYYYYYNAITMVSATAAVLITFVCLWQQRCFCIVWVHYCWTVIIWKCHCSAGQKGEAEKGLWRNGRRSGNISTSLAEKALMLPTRLWHTELHLHNRSSQQLTADTVATETYLAWDLL